ncbi:MAG: chemotaxis protein CheA [Planctomycetota bacterium]|nr:MAG: chemotaxis protein CheA [Planctomycetota bacterium]
MKIDLAEFHAAFFEEAAEHLVALEDGLLQLESQPESPELINAIFRAAHSIKGTGAALGFADVASFTHHMETVLDRMRQHELAPTCQRVELLLRATDALSLLIEAAKGGSPPPTECDALVDALQRQLPGGAGGAATPQSEAFTIFDDEERPGAPPAAPAAPDAEAAPRAPSGHCDTIRVPVAKIEDLMNLVGELVIANSMVQQAFASAAHAPHLMQEALVGMDLTTRQLQERVMAVRLVPLANLFRRFHRVARDLAASLGKNVVLEVTGEETELDKQVIEEMGDPLTHLIRNAVDHGLETPEARLAAGKPAEGRVQLRAYYEGGNVVIEVSDDGHGIDAQRVRDKALAKGLIDPADQLTDEQAYQLILLPGFSTAKAITDVSGRGVGLDVVKRNVEALGGTIAISSEPGRGSCFRVRLPLTTAILDGLAVRIADDVYVLPLLSVIESLRPERKHMVEINGQQQLIMVRGEPLPLIYTHRLFGAAAKAIEPCDGLVVIVEHQARKYGLVVDELVGQLQVVMKSLETNYKRVEGLSGATILGDGRIAMIVDIAGLVRLAF